MPHRIGICQMYFSQNFSKVSSGITISVSSRTRLNSLLLMSVPMKSVTASRPRCIRASFRIYQRYLWMRSVRDSPSFSQ